MLTIKLYDRGDAVKMLQSNLVASGDLPALNEKGRTNVDGIFGSRTMAALMKFQARMAATGKLTSDETTGQFAGPRTIALLTGKETPITQPDFPPNPPFSALGEAGTRRLFGGFRYSPAVAKTTAGEPIKIDSAWMAKNLVTDYIPQLDGIPFYYPGNKLKCSGRVTLHKLAMPIFKRFFSECERYGFMVLIKTFDGGYNPRFQRGSRTALSNHAFGTAVDINAYANGMGKKPAAMGQLGCLLPLVDVANDCGIFWGGFWRGKSCDGMHFEIAKIEGLD